MTRLSRPSFDPGDPIHVEIYVTGWGRCDASKLAIVYPLGLLTSPGDEAQLKSADGELVSSVMVYGAASDDGKGVTREFAVQEVQRFPLGAVGAVIGLNRGYFMPLEHAPGTEQVPPIVGETKFRDSAPLLLKSRIDRKVPSGDHSMDFFLTYFDEGGVQVTRESLTIHIRPFWERPLFQVLSYVLIVLGGVATAVGLAAAAGFRF